MTKQTGTPVTITIEAIDPPFGADSGVLFGLQSRHGVDAPVPASKSTDFVAAVELRSTDAGIDFAGDHVHGRRGDRFMYLSWGLPDQAEPFVMFGRAKIKLAHIPPDLLNMAVEGQHPLRAKFRATNPNGQPTTGTIKPAAIHWTAG